MDCFVRKYFSFLLPVFTIPNVVRFFYDFIETIIKYEKKQKPKQKTKKQQNKSILGATPGGGELQKYFFKVERFLSRVRNYVPPASPLKFCFLQNYF